MIATNYNQLSIFPKLILLLLIILIIFFAVQMIPDKIPVIPPDYQFLVNDENSKADPDYNEKMLQDYLDINEDYEE